MTSRILPFVAVLAFAGIVSSCKSEKPVEPLAPLAIPFESTIDDSLIAATVEYSGRVDTFTAHEFLENLDRLNMLFPEVMQDEERSSPIRQEMVRQYVLDRLVMNEAASRGIAADSAAVEAEVARFKARFDSEEAYQSELAEIHQVEKDLRSQFSSTISRDALIRSIQDSVPEPSPAETQALKEAMSPLLRVQHILIGVPDDPSRAELDASRDRAGQLIDSLDAGRPFAALARRFSDDPGSKISGGELPWFRRGQMVPEFERAAFDLNDPGEYTKTPVRTPYGYHIIRLLDRVKDDVVTADSARTLLVKRLVTTAYDDLQRRLVEQTVVRTNPSFIPPMQPSTVENE